MNLIIASLSYVLAVYSVYALRLTRQDGNDGIHLAVSPICGPFSGNTSDANAGVDLNRVKNIVSFGVSQRVPMPGHIVGRSDRHTGLVHRWRA